MRHLISIGQHIASLALIASKPLDVSPQAALRSDVRLKPAGIGSKRAPRSSRGPDCATADSTP